MSNRIAQKLLLIGWDSADWRIIHPLLDAGKMPNLAKLINEGTMGNMATLYPQISPMLWTSVATGKRAFKHGILGFTEPDPAHGGARPVTRLSRTTKAFWNILSQVGLKSNVIGWWPTHPAEPIGGVVVSDLYAKIRGRIDEPWPLPPGTVHPDRISENLAQLRCHPQQLDAGHILPFVPQLSEVDQDQDERPEAIAKVIAETLSIQDATLAVMRNEPWDLTASYFVGIDHLSHGFIQYHPPKQDHVPEQDFETYRHVVRSAYILHDIVLGELIECAGPDAAVVLVSDHGFYTGDQRLTHIPREPSGPIFQHRPHGIIVMNGPGIRKDELVFGASLLDICPTILSMFGLPIGEDMDGRVLVTAFASEPRITTIESWDMVEDASRQRDARAELNPFDAYDAHQQLAALGYVDLPARGSEEAAKQSVMERDYNLARSYVNANRHADAIPILEGLASVSPDQYRFAILLISCYLSVKRISEARYRLDALLSRKRSNSMIAQERLKALTDRLGEGHSDQPSPEEEERLSELQREAVYNLPAIDYLTGTLLHAEGHAEQAAVHLNRAERADGCNIPLLLALAQMHLDQDRLSDAERCYRKVLSLDCDRAPAHIGLCKCHLARENNRAAAEAALDAIGLLFHNPQAHFLLGVSLDRMGRTENAIEALKMAISQNPNYPQAHETLSDIHRYRLYDLQEAAKERFLAQAAAKRLEAISADTTVCGTHTPESPSASVSSESLSGTRRLTRHSETMPSPVGDIVVVVTGLPRTGTSMLMQVLEAGGVPPYADDVRKPDQDNPRGYYESVEAKMLDRDASWLAGAKGRAVKIIPQRLHLLPAYLSYRIIFTQREIQDTVRSQRQMLRNRNLEGARLSADRIAAVLSADIAHAESLIARRGLQVLFIRYEQAIHKPEFVVSVINRFFHGVLDERQMARAVDPDLHHHRSGALSMQFADEGTTAWSETRVDW